LKGFVFFLNLTAIEEKLDHWNGCLYDIIFLIKTQLHFSIEYVERPLKYLSFINPIQSLSLPNVHDNHEHKFNKFLLKLGTFHFPNNHFNILSQPYIQPKLPISHSMSVFWVWLMLNSICFTLKNKLMPVITS